MSDPITVKIAPDIYAAANNYAVDVAAVSCKAWLDVRDAIAKAIHAERERCAASGPSMDALRAAYDQGWADCRSEPRPFAAARESMGDRYIAGIGGSQ